MINWIRLKSAHLYLIGQDILDTQDRYIYSSSMNKQNIINSNIDSYGIYDQLT